MPAFYTIHSFAFFGKYCLYISHSAIFLMNYSLEVTVSSYNNLNYFDCFPFFRKIISLFGMIGLRIFRGN